MLDGMQGMTQEVVDAAKKVWFASVGALLVAEEKGADLYREMLRRGREVEAQRLAPVAESVKDAVRRTTDTIGEFGKEVDGRVTAAMHRAGVPNRDDIAALTARVEALNASIEKMKSKPKAASKAEPKLAKA